MTPAMLDWSLTVECPYCAAQFDVIDQDSYNNSAIAAKIFTNKWDDVRGCTVSCEGCGAEIELSGIVY